MKFFKKSISYECKKCEPITLGAAAAIAGGVAAINAGSSIAGSMMSSNGSRRSQRRQYYYNQKLMQEQNAWNLEMWNKQNEYNSPAAVRRRLEEAGYSPWLYAEGNQGGSASSPSEGAGASGVSAPTPQVDLGRPGDTLLNGVSLYFQTQQIQQDMAAKQLELEYKQMYNQWAKEHQFPSLNSEYDLKKKINDMGLKLKSLDHIMISDYGMPEGYQDENGKYVAFTPAEQMELLPYVQSRVGLAEQISQRGLAQRSANQQFELAYKQFELAQKRLVNETRVSKAQASALSAQGAHLRKLTEQIQYQMDQLKLTEDKTGKNYQTRLGELQETYAQLQNGIAEIEKDWRGDEKVMNTYVKPIASAVMTIAGAVIGTMVSPGFGTAAGAGIGWSFGNSFVPASSSASSSLSVPANPYVTGR